MAVSFRYAASRTGHLGARVSVTVWLRHMFAVSGRCSLTANHWPPTVLLVHQRLVELRSIKPPSLVFTKLHLASEPSGLSEFMGGPLARRTPGAFGEEAWDRIDESSLVLPLRKALGHTISRSSGLFSAAPSTRIFRVKMPESYWFFYASVHG